MINGLDFMQEKINKIVYEIVRELQRVPTVEDVILRGSLAKGDWKPNWSDLDLVVVLKDNSNISNVHKKISKIFNNSKIPLGIDIVYKIETPSLLKDLHKIGFKSIQSTLETIQFGKSYLNNGYLKTLKNEKKILEKAITPKLNFLFIQDYLWYLRREIRTLEKGIDMKHVKNIVGLIFLITKRFVNLKKPLEIMPKPKDILVNMRELYPNIDSTILERLVELREKSGKNFSKKKIKQLCYQGLEFAEKIYYICLKNKVWEWGGQKRK